MLQGCLEMFDKQVQFTLEEIRDESGTLWHRIPFAWIRKLHKLSSGLAACPEILNPEYIRVNTLYPNECSWINRSVKNAYEPENPKMQLIRKNVILTRSHRTEWIFDRMKILTGHFVHTRPFNISALFTRIFERLGV